MTRRLENILKEDFSNKTTVTNALAFDPIYGNLDDSVYFHSYQQVPAQPPCDLNFGPFPGGMDLEVHADDLLTKDLCWLPILQPHALFKPMEEVLEKNSLYSLKEPTFLYDLDCARNQVTNDMKYFSVKNQSELPFVYADGVTITKFMDEALKMSDYPKISDIKSDSAFTMNDFVSALDSKTNELSEKLLNRNAEGDDNEVVVEQDLSSMCTMTDSEFIKHVINEEKSIVVNLRKKLADNKTKFAKRIYLKQSVPLFEAIRDNMAFNYPFELDPFQKEAILQLEQQHNVLVAAHTSAGKTAVAEYAIALSLKHGMKAVYTSPIKALSNQKFKDFKNTFDNVGLITGDFQINPAASCVIMTTEILRTMLYYSSNCSLSDVEWVIFDEVHYINDESRGVVWEELLILLPRKIKLVLLSATFPNCFEFASWVGCTRNQVFHVISTDKRPVPLEHFLFSGKTSHVEDSLSLILDKHGVFNRGGFKRSMKIYDKTFKGRKFRRAPKDYLLTFIDFLQETKKLPAIIFVFSKKGCFERANGLKNYDFTTKNEKAYITQFFNTCISRLSEEDKNLPQIVRMKQLIIKGIAVHNSGVIPIIRETIELLFQQTLIKVLFATETFSVGVNMPARTVVFLSLRKPTGNGMRDMNSTEYIQMAGRAGRRGIDEVGCVILLYTSEMDCDVIESVITRQPYNIESRFCLNYGMILRTLSKQTGDFDRIEDLMRNSFSEFRSEKEFSLEYLYDSVKLHEDEIKVMEKTLKGCEICTSDILLFRNAYCGLWNNCHKVVKLIRSNAQIFCKIFCSERIVIVRLDSNNDWALGIVSPDIKDVKFINNAEVKTLPIILFISGIKPANLFNLRNILSLLITVSESPMSKFKANLQNTSVHVLNVNPDNIMFIADTCFNIKTLKVKTDSYTFKTENKNFSQSPAAKAIKKTMKQYVTDITDKGLFEVFVPLNIQTFCGNNLTEDENTFLMCYSSQFEAVFKHNYECFLCGNFSEHYEVSSSIRVVQGKIDELKTRISDEGLQLLPEYHSRLEVLKELEFITNDLNLTFKGKLAFRYRNGFEILMAELLVSKDIISFSVASIAALLSCFLTESKPKDGAEINPSEENIQVWSFIESLYCKLVEVEEKHEVESSKRVISFELMDAVNAWAAGEPFQDIVNKFLIDEGTLIRYILRLDETMSEIEDASKYAGNLELHELIHQSRAQIKRSIVFTPSLYLI